MGWDVYHVTTDDGTEVLIYASAASHAAHTAKAKGFVPVRIHARRHPRLIWKKWED